MRKLLLVLSCLPFVVTAASAQDPTPSPHVYVGGAGGGDPLEQHLVPAEIIMRNQSELGITSSQRDQIKEQVSALQTRFTELQWDLQAHVEGLSETLANPDAQEEAVLAQLDQVLASEAQIKRTQLSMLLRIRGILTPEQLKKALELRRQKGFVILPGPLGPGNFSQKLPEMQQRIQEMQRNLYDAQKKLRELQ